jgi:hypothetical protein
MFDVNAAIGGVGSANTGRMTSATAMKRIHTVAVFMLSHPKYLFFWTHYKKKPAYLHPFC